MIQMQGDGEGGYLCSWPPLPRLPLASRPAWAACMHGCSAVRPELETINFWNEAPESPVLMGRHAHHQPSVYLLQTSSEQALSPLASIFLFVRRMQTYIPYATPMATANVL
jgi:hypothetical protein